uniref:Uncharacterized protein n=1 Tax=Fagus sylvatica TaxID=28930 RepID=A0A2N9FDY6_FAGSY
MSLPRRKTKATKGVGSAWAWAKEVARVGKRTGQRRRHDLRRAYPTRSTSFLVL